MKLPHWAAVLISLVAVVVAWLTAQSAAGNLVLPVAVLGVLPLVNAVIAALSPSAVTSTNVKAAALKSTLCSTLAFVAFALVLTACAALLPAVPLAACIATDALKGDSIAVIAKDCEADVPAVIGGLVTSKDPKVLTSPASNEARRAQAALADAGAY